MCLTSWQETKKSEPTEPPAPGGQEAVEDEIDIDLNDPDVGAAALKIQAGFRGHQTRQQLKAKQVQCMHLESRICKRFRI